MSIPLPRWMAEAGPDGDVVLSSRCRIARDLAGEPFPWRASELSRKQVAARILDAAHRGAGVLARAQSIRAEDLDSEEIERLIEWRYVSREWAQGGSHRWLLVAPEGAISLLVHEEDHIRLQAILPGLQVESGQEIAQRAECELATGLDFAHDSRIGFLTASLTNAGLGMRLSVLMHLAGLAASETREATLAAAAEIGCSVRGLYGEGTPGTGELFQVSNMQAWGVSTAQIAERVSDSVRYLIQAERRARRERFGTESGRAHLAAAAQEALRRLFSEEAAPRRLLPLVSILRLAVAEGVLPGELAQTAEWVSLAGAAAASRDGMGRVEERFQAVRRTAALRQRLRTLVNSEGTFDPAICG